MDVLSRSKDSISPSVTVDDSFPWRQCNDRTYRGSQGPELDGVLLRELGVDVLRFLDRPCNISFRLIERKREKWVTIGFLTKINHPENP